MMLLQVGTYQCCFVPYIQQSSNYSIIYLFLVDNYLGKWQHISLGKECWIIIQSYHRTLPYIYIYMYIQLIPVTKTGSAGETGKRIMNFYWRNSHFLFDPPFLDFFFFFGKDIFLLYSHDGCHLCCPYRHHILLTRFMTLWMR